MNIISYLILFFSALAGGLAVFFLPNKSPRNLKLILSFSGAYLFAITVLHLIPEVYASANKYIGVYVLIGFAFQIFLEQFSEGVEHGHIHVHQHSSKSLTAKIMISLSLHAFLEGMPLSQQKDMVLLTGISLHHIPAAFALGSVLHELQDRKRMIILLIVFALMSPLGLFTANIIGANAATDMSSYADPVMAIVIGIFLHISTTILFEAMIYARFNFLKAVAIITGAGIALLSFFL